MKYVTSYRGWKLYRTERGYITSIKDEDEINSANVSEAKYDIDMEEEDND